MEYTESTCRQFITDKGDEAEIKLRLEGVRCAGCLSKIQKSIDQLDGVLECSLNQTHHMAFLRWQKGKVKLDDIFAAITKAGFGFAPLKTLQGEEAQEAAYKAGMKRLVVSIYLTMNLMLVSVSLWAGIFSGMEERFESLFHFLSFCLTTPVIFYGGADFLKGAWAAVKARSLNMDFQIAFNALLIYGYSIFNALRGSDQVYFESAAMFVTFILASKSLESGAVRKMKTMLKTLNLKIPEFGRILRESSVEVVPVDQIKIGDLLELLPGDAIPTDGNVVEGHGEIDESSLTGEYLPVSKKVGERVFSGTFLKNGRLVFQAQKEASESTLAKLSTVLDEALADKRSYSPQASFLHRQFTNIIAALSLLTFWGWLLATGGFDQALLNAVAVFIIACPCALALATPLAFLSGFKAASKHRIIMKAASDFRKLGEITDVVFDKTGTLTMGRATVVASLGGLDNEDTEILSSLLGMTRHTVAEAVRRHIGSNSSFADEMHYIEELSGKGLKCQFRNTELLAGNQLLLESAGVSVSPEFVAFCHQHHSATLLFFSKDGLAVSVFALQDEIRPEAQKVCSALADRGLTLRLCSGDRNSSVESFAAKLDVFSGRVHAEMNPQDKSDYIKRLQGQGRKVLFVGDGLNDSPAMARADLSISMNGGIDLALDNADLIFLENDIRPLASAFKLSSQVLGLVKQNMMFSAAYNLLSIPLAVAGLVIPPVAAASMSISSLLVVGNSLFFSRRSLEKN